MEGINILKIEADNDLNKASVYSTEINLVTENS